MSARFRPRQTKYVIEVLTFFFVTMKERNVMVEERNVTTEKRNISS